MRFLSARRFLIAAIILAVAAPATWLLARDKSTGESALIGQVKRGDFRVTVTTSGELRAPKFVQVTLPSTIQQAQIYQQLKISTLVPEGSVVKEGDLVAEIDRTPVANKHTEVSLALQKAEAQYEQAMLDSTMKLGKAREDQKTMELTLEEKRIAKEQAVFEAPSVKRQAELDYEKAERAMAQAKVDYKTQTEQAMAKMREVGADRDRQKNLQKIIMEVMQGLTITAPAPGMVIYVKEWSGKKKTTGSQVGPWEPAVATLPDLSIMESLTYVNEIDVRKLRVGQPVAVTLDADPSKHIIGTIKQVANVGEQRPNADAKVFEVLVNIEKPDTSLRPGMTTGNEVETQSLKDVLFIPLDALVVEEGIPVVFKQDGDRVIKQEVATGAMNDDEVVIVKGLAEGETVLLAPPLNRNELVVQRLPGSENAPPPGVSGDTVQRRTVPPAAEEKKATPSATGEKKAAPPVTPARKG